MAAPTPADLATSLGVPLADLDTTRAQMLIDDAIADALSIVVVGTVPDTGATYDNLPAGSDSVIRAAAGRVYLNAGGVTSETVGPFSVTRPAPSGATLSGRERRKLLRLAGLSGAFSIDSTPAAAMTEVIDPAGSPDLEDAETIDLDLDVF